MYKPGNDSHPPPLPITHIGIGHSCLSAEQVNDVPIPFVCGHIIH